LSPEREQAKGGGVVQGEVRATIAREIGRLQSEYYGRGPTKAKTYLEGDVVVVVL
jgi:uncharacterized protein YbcI